MPSTACEAPVLPPVLLGIHRGSPCNHHLHHHLPQNEAEWHRWPQGIAFKAENRQTKPQKARKKKNFFLLGSELRTE